MRRPTCACLLWLTLLLVGSNAVPRRLNDWVSHYEPLTYDTDPVHRSHQRAKRSVSEDSAVQLHFRAHNRAFSLRLKRDLETFSDRLEVVTHEGDPLDVDTSHIYKGHILGEPESYVFGSIINGVFEGKIHSPHTGGYFIEKANKYFPNQTFHSLIYHENDVEDPHASKRNGYLGGCGHTEEISQWMERVQNSAVEEEDLPPFVPKKEDSKPEKKAAKTEKVHFHDEDPRRRYTREANEGVHQRSKRAARPREENRNTCSLFIQTDPLIWKHISEQQVTQDPEKIREEILSLIAQHVHAVNYIYRDTKFDGRIEHRNIKFEVQRIKIDDDIPCKTNGGDSNQFCMENIDVSNFLNLHSLGNHEDFCLAYVFTYRDFTGGTLGLAWVASASGASGGICEKYKTYTETVGGIYQSTKRSLNTGIITFVNYNSRVPLKVSQLTLAHEIGHNFGSPHDYPSECRPGGDKGNFIMFASATSGDRPNNSKFSACSVGNISNVLDAIEDSKKRNCFTTSAGAFCGNKIVEQGEECDCGFNDEECKDKCCYPRIVSEVDKMRNNSAAGCHRRARTQCSPSQGPCCDGHTCTFVKVERQLQCRGESECSFKSYCNGGEPECPVSKPKSDKTRCNEETQLCIKGECTGSICLEWNMQECFLTSGHASVVDKRRLCELACKNGSEETCRSTSEFSRQVGLPEGGISLRPGSPCDNYQGYCDVFLKCRAVDAEGPLARLKNLLFNRETLQTVAQWVTEYWWAVLLMGIAFVVVMGCFIKCCAVHTPSSNPKKQPARRLSETLRHPMHTLRRMRGPGGASRAPPRGSNPPRGPARGYGEGRGQYYVPKGSAGEGGGRSSGGHEPYAGAYGGRSSGNHMGRNSFEMHNHKV
ncbi:disintegrin and metalloproteinase domain-containing protein 10 [Neocloeon triangulifer]|uniref:disintegrin and metalloproteinase domain-containing protein 10 n=1 Tax=Neocloeon triangulifer TaxID=2078957 RepID=UPI00286F646D|nr:disintegrin and metalloproteinase domain-containing protein 10 [Neocloeon triangulifer]